MAAILVVDDYPATREILVELLGSSGHSVLEASDGAEALGLVRATRPDLVITDILMPTMDGHEFVRQLRADPTIAGMPVIFYSGVYTQGEAEALARACGVGQVITKPFGLDMVLRIVDATLSVSSLPPAPPPPPSPGESDRLHLRLLADKLSQKVNDLETANQELAAEARFLQAQIEVARVAVSSLQPEVLAPRLLEAVVRAQGYRYGALWRVTEDRTAAVVVAIAEDVMVPFAGFRRELSDPHSFVAYTIRTGRPTFQNRVQESLFATHPIPLPVRREALLGLPLINRTGSVHGALTFADMEHPNRFTERDLIQGEVLASQVAQALENSELFSRVQQLEEQYRVVTHSLNDAIYTVDTEGRVMFCNAALEQLTGYRMDEVIDHSSARFYTANVLPVLRERRRQAFRGEQVTPHMETQMIRKDGARVPVELSSANLVVGGQISGRAIVVRDLTERKRAEEEGRWRQRAAELMAELARSITASLELDTVLQCVVEGAKELCDSDIVSIALRDGGSEAMIIRHWTGARYQGYETVYIQPGKGIGGLALATGALFRTDHYAEDPRVSKDYIGVIREEGIVSAMVVPIKMGDRLEGVIYLANRAPRPFTDRDERIVLRLADHAAIAIRNARLHEQVRNGRERLRRLTQQVTSAQEAERQRLSRELHDEAGQTLTALKISLELLQADMSLGFEPLHQRIAEAIALTDTTLERIRVMAHELRPPALDVAGLSPALEGLCRDFGRQTQLAIAYESTALPTLPETITICLYRFLQEALTNVAKHAHAQQVRVALSYDGATVSLSVEDDGQGFEAQARMALTSATTGIGLLGIQERLELLGGRLELDSNPGQGTRLVAHIPWQRAT